MTHLFIPYLESSELKKLNFNEPCLALFDETVKDNIKFEIISSQLVNSNYNTPKYFYKPSNYPVVLTPTWSQIFDWFREKHGLLSRIVYINSVYRFQYQYLSSAISTYMTKYSTYEEAQLACLQKLIEICKNDNTTRS